MTPRVYIAFFVAIIGVCVGANVDINRNILFDVFGDPSGYKSSSVESNVAASANQAQAVTPSNDTLVDLDYWDSMDDLVQSNVDYDKFDWIITKRIAATSTENFLLSPLGLKLALAILAEAATGPTQQQLASVLGFDVDRQVVRRKFASIIDSLKKESKEYTLNLGSRIYIENSALPRQRYAAIAEVFYKTEIKTVDFFNPTVAAKEINIWVSDITQGKIPALVDENDIVGMVVLILNTLYFKGSWRHQFAPNATVPGTFYVSAKEDSIVPFMRVKSNFYYAESTKLDAKILRLPYRGRKFAMYIIVPNSLTGITRVLNNLSDLRTEMNNLQELTVDVKLPKFKFDYTSQLDGILKELGIRDAFEDTASFPGISRGQLLHQKLRVSKVLQRDGIEINEIGTVAYAATEISLVNKFGEDTESNFEVNANKPFLFFIQDESTKQLLFTGRVSDPALLDGAFKLT